MNDILTITWGLQAPLPCHDHNSVICVANISYKVLNVAAKDYCENLLRQELNSFMFNLAGKYNTAIEVINGANFNELINYHKNGSNSTVFEIVSADFNPRQNVE